MPEERDEQTPLLDSASSIRSEILSVSSAGTDPSEADSNVAVIFGEPDAENTAASVSDNQQTKPALDTRSLVQVIAVLAIGKRN